MFDQDNDYLPPPPRMNTTTQWILWGFAVFLLLGLLFTWAAYSLGWITKPLELSHPDNLERMSAEANERWQSLEAQRADIASIQLKMDAMEASYGTDRRVWPQGKADEWLQLLQQRQNLVSAYNHACAEYRALWEDEWKGLTLPPDLPTTCELYQY